MRLRTVHLIVKHSHVPEVPSQKPLQPVRPQIVAGCRRRRSHHCRRHQSGRGPEHRSHSGGLSPLEAREAKIGRGREGNITQGNDRGVECVLERYTLWRLPERYSQRRTHRGVHAWTCLFPWTSENDTIGHRDDVEREMGGSENEVGRNDNSCESDGRRRNSLSITSCEDQSGDTIGPHAS